MNNETSEMKRARIEQRWGMVNKHLESYLIRRNQQGLRDILMMHTDPAPDTSGKVGKITVRYQSDPTPARLTIEAVDSGKVTVAMGTKSKFPFQTDEFNIFDVQNDRFETTISDFLKVNP